MFILVFSDSHGELNEMRKIISSYENVDLVIHLGDYLRDVLALKDEFKDTPFEFVLGNNDYEIGYKREYILEIYKIKVLITHGHLYGVKSTFSKLFDRAQKLGVDVALFGHTHYPHNEYKDNILMINPGSIGYPILEKNPTYCEISIKDDVVKAFIKSTIEFPKE